MRKESSNQFTEGLVCDLNPINTPNTVLIDALNATIITYNGNEFSLQNDRGNYPLKNCKLKPNYIPVGIKEYGDILYIVSYNPLDNHVEIGTYPSPVEVVGQVSNKSDFDLYSVIENAEYDENGCIDYSDLIEYCETKIWTFENEDASKLYPGDEYCLDEIPDLDCKYETLEYLIIDEVKQKHNITNLVKKDGEWHPVAWQIPGWLAVQYRIATFDDFTMSVRSMQIPKVGEGLINGYLQLNFQLRISDNLLLNEDVKSDLYIKIQFENLPDSQVPIYIPLTEAKFVNWYGSSKILWLDWGTLIKDVAFNQTISFCATPVIKIGTKEIVYNSFSETYSIYLNSIGSYSDFNIGDEIWKFYIEEDDTSKLYLEYDISGPNVTTTDVKLYYRVNDIQGNPINNGEWNEVTDYTGITNQGVGTLPFHDDFIKESIYIIEFVFYKPLEKEQYSELDKQTVIKKLVIASEIFADFVGEYNNFNDISFDEWILKYKNSIKSINWKSEHDDQSNPIPYSNYTIKNGKLELKDDLFESDNLENLWDINSENKGIFDDRNLEWLLKQQEIFNTGNEGLVDVTIKHETKALTGPLWEDTPKIKIELKSLNEDVVIDKTRQQLMSENTISQTIRAVFGKTIVANYIKNNEYTITDGIEYIRDVPIIHLHTNTRKTNANETVEGTIYNYGTWPNVRTSGEETEYMEDGRSYVKGNNKLSEEIKTLLKDYQMAVLIVTTHSGYIDGKFQLRHGSNKEWSTWNNYNTWGFVYLVFRESDTSTGKVVLIPIKNSELWEKEIGNGNVSDLTKAHYNLLTKTTEYLQKLCKNIFVCNKDNAVRKVNAINIQLSSEEIIPICNVKIYAPPITRWNIQNYNLLNYNDRKSLIKDIGESICGELLTGSTTSLPEVEFYQTIVENKKSNIGNLNDIVSLVNNINSSIKEPEIDNVALYYLETFNTNTKGIYWTGGSSKPTQLLNLLDDNYRNTDNIKLSANGKIVEANVYLTQDADGIVFANVNASVNAKFND